MPAGLYNFVIEQGATFSKVLTWKDSTGNPVDLTGYTAQLEIKDAPKGVLILALSTVAGGITLGGVSGTITLAASAITTEAITQKKGVYNLELTAASGVVTRLLQGKVNISQDI